MKKQTGQPDLTYSYTSLAIRRQEDQPNKYELITSTHAADGTLIKQVIANNYAYFSVVNAMKRAAADTWGPLAVVLA